MQQAQEILWNIFSDDGSLDPDAAASRAAQAMARYARREVSCMSLTDKEAILSGNFMFTSLENQKARE
ncbi:ubiquinol-cytochrome-c reductase complex assembly factor 1 [Quillaja saponaria]|uniref:Ubiquinol-cytochrome-c reductase complex assembly factor 1 n=1 Tax=Quillaja saponaria TaxID=32244 RepID=A0AAD7L1F5_QUISA|nr:ubiquinol-cytochrome-c reductase complex assembly factor 1 [Quillaja saponaria]